MQNWSSWAEIKNISKICTSLLSFDSKRQNSQLLHQNNMIKTWWGQRVKLEKFPQNTKMQRKWLENIKRHFLKAMYSWATNFGSWEYTHPRARSLGLRPYLTVGQISEGGSPLRTIFLRGGHLFFAFFYGIFERFGRTPQANFFFVSKIKK